MLRITGARVARSGAAWCALGRLAGAQVAGIGVDPHMVVLTEARPSGEITVLNPHARRAEFSVDLRFGFATTDSNGKLMVQLADSADSASAAGFVTPYPRRFALAPGATRTVRLLAKPPRDLPGGEYWARLTVHARDVAAPSGEDTDSLAGTVRFSMESATVLPVFFRKGDLSTGVNVSSVEAIASTDAIHVQASLRREGNAAFIGVAHITVRDTTGRTIATADRPLAVYRSMRPRWSVPIPAASCARGCSVTIQLSTRRHDVPRNLLLQPESLDTVVTMVRNPP